jgi:hypothetical protein
MVSFLEDLSFGEYVTRVVPGDGQPENYRLTETSSPDAVFLEVSPPWRNADIYRLTGISGTYPGTPEPHGDYSFILGMFVHTGEITTIDGAASPSVSRLRSIGSQYPVVVGRYRSGRLPANIRWRRVNSVRQR